MADELSSEGERLLGEYVEHMLTAREQIIAKEGQKRGVTGTIPCPKCGAELQYSISDYNGHIWGRCETPGCLNWME